jgi:hypothetical protein
LAQSLGFGMALAFGCSLQDFDALGREANDLDGFGGASGIVVPSPQDSGSGASGGSTSSSGGQGGTTNVGRGGSSAVAGAGGRGQAGTGATGFDGDAGIAVGNLIQDPSFELGFAGWIPFGTSALSISQTESHTGVHSLVSSGRTQAFEGPAFGITALVVAGARYEVAVWVLPEAGTQTFKLSLKTRCEGQTDDTATYAPLVEVSVGEALWGELAASFTAPSECNVEELRLYVEGPPAGVGFFIDDASLVEVQQ